MVFRAPEKVEGLLSLVMMEAEALAAWGRDSYGMPPGLAGERPGLSAGGGPGSPVGTALPWRAVSTLPWLVRAAVGSSGSRVHAGGLNVS